MTRWGICLSVMAVAAAATVAVALPSSGAGPAGPAAASGPSVLPVTGYAETGTAAGAVSASARALRTLGVDGVNISKDGAAVPAPDAAALAQLRQARQQHLRAEFLVGNYSGTIGDFDPDAAEALVTSQAHTRSVVATLAAAVTRQGWDGITVDLEAVKAQDREGLTAFVTALKRALPAGRTVSLAVTASTDAQGYLDNGYDLARLGKVLDRVVLMGYDQHGPTWTGPGPVGGLPWQRQTLTVLLGKVPAAKVDLGVAGYGYRWPRTGTGGMVADAEARGLVKDDGATAKWRADQGEWTAVLHDGTVRWWSDARSWPLRVSLARAFHLHGMALWALGISDPLHR